MKKWLLIICLLMFMCSEDDQRDFISPITSTDLPSHADMGETITFKVHHAVFNGCGHFSRYETTVRDRIITVTFYAKYSGGICTDNIPILETSCSIKPTMKGPYYFKFFQNNFDGQQYLLDTLIVN